MAVGVGAATIWKERTGEGQDLKVDVRESLYNVNPFMMPLLKADKAAGRAAPDDPIPDSFKFVPSINGRFYQAPLLIGHPHVRPQTAVAN